MIYLKLLIESHFFLLSICFIVYVIEKFTGLMLLYGWFKYKKDLKTAMGTADGMSIIYFLFNLGFVIYKVYLKKSITGDFNFIIFFMIIIFLTVIFRKLYFKYQGIDPSKPDWEGKL